jgi:recombinational DNA repair protein (RecF pathway)
MDTKYCWMCKQTKPPSDYCRKGADSCCRACRLEVNKKWASDHKVEQRPKRAAYMREYRLAQKAKKLVVKVEE